MAVEISVTLKGESNIESAVEKSNLTSNEELSDLESLQAGVQRAEILRKGWTKQGLIVTFIG